MAKTMTLAEAMKGAQPDPDNIDLSLEQRYLKVIQALVAENGGEFCVSPHVFLEPDTLVCEQDALGNMHLTAKKGLLTV